MHCEQEEERKRFFIFFQEKINACHSCRSHPRLCFPFIFFSSDPFSCTHISSNPAWLLQFWRGGCWKIHGDQRSKRFKQVTFLLYIIIFLNFYQGNRVHILLLNVSLEDYLENSLVCYPFDTNYYFMTCFMAFSTCDLFHVESFFMQNSTFNFLQWYVHYVQYTWSYPILPFDW